MQTSMRAHLARHASKLAGLSGRLEVLDPAATLARGYAIVRDEKGRVVSDAAAVGAGTRVTAQLARGELDLTVESVRERDD